MSQESRGTGEHQKWKQIKLMKPSVKYFVKEVTPWTLRDNVRMGIRSLKGEIWRFLSSRKLEEAIDSKTLYSKQSFPFQEIDFFNDYISLFESFGFASLYSYQWNEGVKVIDRISLIEPGRGWIICPPFHLIRDCLIDSNLIEKPWILNYLSNYWSKNAVIEHYPTLISLRDSAECNYWHFFNDLVGGRLRLIEECGLEPNIPIVIAKSLYNKPFFQATLKRSNLSDRQLILQEDQFIQSDKIFYCQTSRHHKKTIEYILNFLNISDSKPKADRKIFLTRDCRVGRNIINIDAIKEVCQKFKFEFIDPGQMSLDEQIQLFSESRYVIGTHGAGLINIIFRKNAMLSLLEIFPPMSNHPYKSSSPPPLHYFYYSHVLGFSYDLIFGKADIPGPWTNSFELDVDLFAKKVKNMLEV